MTKLSASLDSIPPAVVSAPFAAPAGKRRPLAVKNFDSFAASVLRQHPAGIALFDDARRSVTLARTKSVPRDLRTAAPVSLYVIRLYSHLFRSNLPIYTFREVYHIAI